MKKQEKRVRGRTTPKRDYLALAGVFAYIAALIYRIPLWYFIGDKGIAYFSVANELYLILTGMFCFGLSNAVASLVKYRVRREQFKSAARVLNGAITIAVILGISLSLALLLGGFYLSDKFMNIRLSGMAVSLMAPAFVFSLVTGVIEGYFQGSGSRVPALHGKILGQMFIITGGLISAFLLYRYGGKVSAILQNNDYASAYGAMGAGIGILLSAVLCFAHMLLLYLIYRNTMKRQMMRDTQRAQEGRLYVTRVLFGTALPFFLLGAIYNGICLTDQYLFMNFGKEGIDKISLWGNYYGKYMVVIGIAAALISLIIIEPVRKIVAAWERTEHRAAKERIAGIIHHCAVITVPAAVFTAVLAENILDLLFKGNNAATAGWVQWGSVIIIFYCFTNLFMMLLMKLRKILIVIGVGIAAFLVHAGVICILLTNKILNMEAVIAGNIVFYAIIAIAGYIVVQRLFQFKQEWIKCFGITVMVSAVCGLIVMLLNKAVVSIAGTGISLLICLPIGIAAYMLLLLMTKALTEHDLENMSGGAMIIRLAKMIQLM